jgi:hypothetical protein
MLSPNARNRVADSRGGVVTVTANVHDEARARESVTVHVTVLVPIGNFDPLGGVQVGPVSGGVPSVAIAGL